MATIELFPEEGQTKEVGLQPAGFNIESLISKAIEQNICVETMEKLLAMRRELKEEFAREQFNRCMAGFQAACPEIKKTKKVFQKHSNQVRYSYAPLESIIAQVKDSLKDYGFSYLITTAQKETNFTAICVVNHVDGHSVETSFTVPIDPDAYMSDQQKVASASTYAKRYAFCNAFGIMTADEDNDANNDDHPGVPAGITNISAAKRQIIKLLQSKVGGRNIYSADEIKEKTEKITRTRYSLEKLKNIIDGMETYIIEQQSDINPNQPTDNNFDMPLI